jgi:hypothetical protein
MTFKSDNFICFFKVVDANWALPELAVDVAELCFLMFQEILLFVFSFEAIIGALFSTS